MSFGLEAVALVEGAVAAGTVAGISGHFAHARRRLRRETGSAGAALAGLRAAALGTGSAAEAGAGLARLPVRLQVALTFELLGPLGRTERGRVAEAAEVAGLVGRAERWCASRRWWRRLHGVRLLALLGRGEGLVPALLADSSADVRAEAAAWAAGTPDPEVVERLLDLLEDPETLCRLTVKDSLLRLGAPVVAPLARRLPELDGRALREGLEVAAALADSRLQAAALPFCEHADPAVRAPAIDVVGNVGGDAATARLLEHLGDGDPAPRAAAARALGHLGHWPAATRLAPLLGDRSWEVRRASGVALRGLGAPGALMLRGALADADPFAADMARQLLEIPPSVDLDELG